jgi:hypothetical protein
MTDEAAKKTAEDEAEAPLLPLLLATLNERDLTPDDFPNAEPLPWPDSVLLIAKSLDVGRVHCAHLLAIPWGFPRAPKGGRVEWALRRWLKQIVAAKKTEPAIEETWDRR